MGKVTEGASILGMFIIGALAMAWQVVIGFFSPAPRRVPQRAQGGARSVS